MGTVKLAELDRTESGDARLVSCSGGYTGDASPFNKPAAQSHPIVRRRQQMTAHTEQIGDQAKDRQESLGMLGDLNTRIRLSRSRVD